MANREWLRSQELDEVCCRYWLATVQYVRDYSSIIVRQEKDHIALIHVEEKKLIEYAKYVVKSLRLNHHVSKKGKQNIVLINVMDQ